MSIVNYTVRDEVALIQMDDGKANALSPDMIAQLSDAFDRALEEAKAVVLTGREGRFCGGFDLKVVMSGPEPAKALFSAGTDLYLKMYALGIPLVAACSGHAVAGGVLLLGASDVRIGAEGAFKLGLNETAIGMPLPIFAHTIASERLARPHLFAATLGATLFSPAEAVEVGWLDEVVAQGALIERAMAEATRLAPLAGDAFRISKVSMRGATIAHVRDTLDEDLSNLVGQLKFN
ncbi:MAG: crotonase/enoyl-CoA hydratase family protein [Sandaracinaceae bacterium]